MRRAVVALVLALTACTQGAAPPSGKEPAPAAPAIELPVILSGSRAEAEPYLAGMRLAAGEVGPVEGKAIRLTVLEGDPARRIVEALEDPGPPAILVVGSAAPVAEQRPAIQTDGRPVFVLGGDLYSSRALFRQAFQTSIPSIWQARAVARYLARDRGYRSVLVAHEPTRQPDRDAFLTALREEGLDARDVPLGSMLPAADAVVYLGSAEGLEPVVAALADEPDPPQLAISTDALRADLDLPAGTVAPGHYAWAPWAEAIPRVAAFRERLGHPVGHEQEGHDAIRLLAEALERTDGRTGDVLVRALERNRPDGPTFSALPIILGPDDHTFADETWVGLYAVPGPGEPREVPQTPWRPIIRTFTFDGERTIFREEDRTVFFPFWKPNRPSPYYFRAAIGIATGPDDPLH